jgi:hypothetical protein
MKTGPKALYILAARDRQDAGFNIAGKLSEKIRIGNLGQRTKMDGSILSVSSDTNYGAVSSKLYTSGEQHWIVFRPLSKIQYLTHRPQKIAPEVRVHTVSIIETNKCQLYICLVFKDRTMFNAHIMRYF